VLAEQLFQLRPKVDGAGWLDCRRMVLPLGRGSRRIHRRPSQFFGVITMLASRASRCCRNCHTRRHPDSGDLGQRNGSQGPKP
jgi:hypothetical protein